MFCRTLPHAPIHPLIPSYQCFSFSMGGGGKSREIRAKGERFLPLLRVVAPLGAVWANRIRLRCASPAASIIRLHIDPRAIVGDRRRRGAVVHEIARAQELRGGRDVGVEDSLDHRTADLLDHPDADLAAVRRREECGLARLLWRAFSSLPWPFARRRWGFGSRAMNVA